MQIKKLKFLLFGGFLFATILLPVSFVRADTAPAIPAPHAQDILAKIQEQQTKIQKAKKDPSCEASLGQTVEFTFRLKYLGFKDFVYSKIQIGKSQCFLRDQSQIERGIVNLVFTFQTSSLACNEKESTAFQASLDELEGLLKDFRDTSEKNPEYAESKGCSIDSRSELFAKTIQAWETLKKKIKEIVANIKNMKKNGVFSFDTKAIESRARANADSFWTDITQMANIQKGLTTEYNRTSSRVRGLGDGTSFYRQPTTILRNQEDILKEYQKRQAEFEKKANDYSILLQQKEKTELEGKEYVQRYLQRKLSLESFLDFDMALAEIGKEPLEKIRVSLDETSKNLKKVTEAIKKYNNRTNTAKEPSSK